MGLSQTITTSFPIHPAAELFPMMADAELRELANDIKENGLLEPIVVHDNKVLDGRNRLRACELAGVDAEFEYLDSVASPTIFVLSKNLHRRHLTTSQRAAIAAEMLPMLAEEAKKRQEASRAKSGEKIGSHRSAPIDTDLTGRSREIAAKALQIGGSSVTRAVAVKKADPEAFEKVKRGEITVNAAYDGHKEQPRRGGSQSSDITNKRGAQRAEAHKRRMVDGLSVAGGICHGLGTLDAGLVAAVCSAEEINTWATKAEANARELRRFAAKLREAGNGKSESSTDGTVTGGFASDSPEGTAGNESELPKAAS